MTNSEPRLPNVIIGGVNKAGTTSVFSYLSSHPQACGSSIKETHYFSNEYTGNKEADIKKYSSYFVDCDSDADVVFEASPGYLMKGTTIGRRIYGLVPNVKLIFILREPVDRLYSFYNYYASNYRIDSKIGFDQYVDKCFAYALQNRSSDSLGVAEGQLKYFEYGDYVNYLEQYYEIFPRDNIKIIFFEAMKADPTMFMCDICDFLQIDSSFYKNYDFVRINETYYSKRKVLHKLAMFVNGVTQSILRKRPFFKKKLINFYRHFNGATKTFPPMSLETRERLQDYYRKSNLRLADLLEDQTCPDWVTKAYK